MVCSRCFCPTAFFYATLNTQLRLGKLFHNHSIIMTDIFSDMICMNACVIARVVYVYPLQVHLSSPPLNLECVPCLNFSTDAPIHYDHAST